MASGAGYLHAEWLAALDFPRTAKAFLDPAARAKYYFLKFVLMQQCYKLAPVLVKYNGTPYTYSSGGVKGALLR